MKKEKTNEELRAEFKKWIDDIPDDQLKLVYKMLKMTGAIKE